MNTRSSTRKTRSKSNVETRKIGVTKTPSRRTSTRLNPQELKKNNSVVVELEERPQSKRRRIAKGDVQEPVAKAVTPKPIASTSRFKKRIGVVANQSDKMRTRGKNDLMAENALPDRFISAKDSGKGTGNESLIKPEKALDEKEQSLKRKYDEFIEEVSSFRKMQAALGKRETALAKKEQALSRATEKLEKRTLAVKQREKEAEDLVTSLAVTRAEDALARLEENLTCALCFDVMACPYSLVPGQCGHSYCAICILKWFFSHLHYECGGWHEVLECPLCRSSLPFPQDNVPRQLYTCPFTPNRLGDKMLTDLVDSMRDSGPEIAGSSKGKKKQKAVGGSSVTAAWCEGGSARLEWQGRERRGRAEMKLITSSWSKLTANDFRTIRDRLRI
ncbi:hypothetical protein AcW1_006599 [Taiwanofungus camphoratus]|nr:hypothetical protein AcW1_006599 [Antrodia cinnamomea]